MPSLKVCGVRALADVEPALELGLDTVGLVAWPRSPRCLSAREARALVAALPARILPVAVLVDATPEEALAFLAESGARAVQLCGRESAEHWTGFPHPVLRRVAVDEHGAAEIERWRAVAELFVLDHPSSPGGSGRTVDLELAAALAHGAPCWLAGGLDEHNVAERVRRVRPRGVDASSLLEHEPGRKDPERVRRFVAAARAALEAL